MPDQNPVLLQTKLHQPHLPHDLVERTKLLEWLNEGIDHPLTLVCAPAGYGKTTLICTWLNQLGDATSEGNAPIPSAWISLDEAESDINLFLQYFIAAVQQVYGGSCRQTLMLLQAGKTLPDRVLYISLSNELERLPGDLILVLDDYHFIHGQAVNELLVEFTRHWPKLLHLVLISRIDPSLPLANLRAKEMVREIRTQNLRFTPDETAAYLNKAQFIQLHASTLELLEKRYEGWPAGLHLAAISLRSAGSQKTIEMALSNEEESTTGYLMDEVLNNQFPAIHDFLLKTSILDRFSAALCETVMGEMDATWNIRACLDWIERSELFLLPLDNHHEWYRYHHLFQQFLKRKLSAELSPAKIADLHRRASAWFEDQGLLEEALKHSLEAGDYVMVVKQMSAGLRELLNHEDRPTLERWLSLLPDDTVQRDPRLLMIKAWVLQFTWRTDLLAQALQKIEELLKSMEKLSLTGDEIQFLRAQLHLFSAQRAYFSNLPEQAIEHCRQALQLLPEAWSFGRGAAMLFLGYSMQSDGQGLAAERILLDEYEASSDKSNIYALFILESLCEIYLHSGDLQKTRQVAQLLLQGSTQVGNAFMTNMADWYLGFVFYQLNELDTAASHFFQVIENRFNSQIVVFRDAVAGLALIYQFMGNQKEELQIVELVSQYDLGIKGSEEPHTRSLRARLSLNRGDLSGAERWANTLNFPVPDQPLMWLVEPQVTRIRVMVARGGEQGLKQAFELLDSLEEIADRTHNTLYKIEMLALRALATSKQGKTRQAELILKKALDLAQPGGFIRIFLDYGMPMQEMLQRLVDQDYSSDLPQRILEAFFQEEEKSTSRVTRLRHTSSAKPALMEPLTPREFEILALLREPLSIKEIAQQLHISYPTARRHAYNLYGKLGVNRRMDAVVRAEELKIIPHR